MNSWEKPNENGEKPGDICCLRASGGVCYDHDPKNYPPFSDHVALARSRTWNGGDPWHFIAYCRLLLGLPEEGPAPYGLIDDAIHGNRK